MALRPSSPARAAALAAGVFVALGLVLVLAPAARGGRVTLKDGTVLEGTVIKTADGYWVKGPNGQSRQVKTDEIESLDNGTGPARPANPGITTPTTPKSPAGAAPSAPAGKTSAGFQSAQARAATVDAPAAAVAIWQEFIDTKPSASDLAAAQAEMAKWKELADGHAEKIKGRWVGGDERKKILDKASGLTREAFDLMRKNQTLQAVKKLEEAAAVYPNSFDTNFGLGYLSMLQHQEDKAVKYFEAAMKQRPNSPECLGNIGVAMAGKSKRGVTGEVIAQFQKAAEAGDTKEIAQNLVTAVSHAPPTMRNSRTFKQAEESARLLASKYSIGGPAPAWMLVPLRSSGGPGAPAIAGTVSGTGFLIAKDGLILTNRHVVENSKTLMVLMNGSVQKSADLVVIDDEQDLALIRIKGVDSAGTPFLSLSPADSPADGAECTVMGYPLIDRLGAAIKVTRGIVSSGAQRVTAGGPDVVVDAKVNPGNSGGPILDRFGNVMAIVSMKSLASATEDSYGLGISAGKVRQFLKKNKIDAKAGANGAAGLSAEEIAAKVKPAAVCIIATR